MEGKRIKSVFSVLGAVVLSIILILLSVFVPITFSITRLTETETVVNIVQHINYEEIIRENEELKKLVNSAGLEPEAVNTLLQTNAAKSILSAYTKTATAILSGLSDYDEFNAETVKTIVNDNIEELASVKVYKNSKEFSKEEIKKIIKQLVDKNAEAIVDIFPDTSVLSPTAKTVKTVTAVKATFSARTIIVLLISVLLLSVAIFFLRKKGLKGLLWLGIDFFIASFILCLISIAAKIGISALSVTNLYSSVFGAAASFCTERIIWSIFSVLLLAVCFIVSFILIKGFRKKELKETDI